MAHSCLACVRKRQDEREREGTSEEDKRRERIIWEKEENIGRGKKMEVREEIGKVEERGCVVEE